MIDLNNVYFVASFGLVTTFVFAYEYRHNRMQKEQFNWGVGGGGLMVVSSIGSYCTGSPGPVSATILVALGCILGALFSTIKRNFADSKERNDPKYQRFIKARQRLRKKK